MPRLNVTHLLKHERRYAYEATWSGEEFVVWDAKVRLDGLLIATPLGELRLEAGESAEAAVRREVERAIEHRLFLNEP